MLNTVFTWLKTLPGLEMLNSEQLDAAPGASGLFCKGRRELRRESDILGTVRIRQSIAFTLCLHSTDRNVPEFFLKLDTADAPILGEHQTVTVTGGKLSKDDGSGICRFETTITFTFTSEG